MSEERRTELKNAALEMLQDDELFVEMVNELDSWNGFADGFRCYPMYEIDELFAGCSVSDFLDKLTSDFNHTDEYMVDTIYGLSSTDYIEDVYRDNVDDEELLENLIDNFNNLYISNQDFSEILEALANDED